MNSTDLRPGMAIKLDGRMYVITQYTHVTPGNLRAFVQIKIKNLESGVIIEKRLRSGEEVEQIELDRRPMEYLFSSGGTHTFMDSENYEQHELSDDLVGELMVYVKPNTQVVVLWANGKPISIELCAGATLKLDDLEVGGEFDLRRPSVFTIRIDGEGRPAAAGQPASPDTFAWGVFHDVINPDGGAAVAASTSRFNETPHTGIPITGDWQDLGQGVKVRFGGTTGHNKGSTWFVSYDGPEAYGIRIGHGTQPHSIDNVRITGLGTIDMNAGRNVQPSFLVKDINACVLVHGRVRNVLIQGITMVDTNRSVMCYGEHTGEFLPGGGVIADNLRIHDNTGQPVVVLGAPKGWKAPEPPVLRDNRNPLSDAAAARAAH